MSRGTVVKKCRRCKRRGFSPWVRKISWRWKGQPTLVFLPGESHGQTSLTGYSPWGCKELDATECTHTHTHKYNFLVFTQGNFEKFIYISFS